MTNHLKQLFTNEHEGHWVAHKGGTIYGFNKSIDALMADFPEVRKGNRAGNPLNLTFVPVGFIS